MSEMIASEAVVLPSSAWAWSWWPTKRYLTGLDQQMGDGDLGITLSKIGGALDDYAAATPVDGDLGKWLGKAGMAANKAGSSSFGTLLATALMRGGKVVSGQGELTAADLVAMFRCRCRRPGTGQGATGRQNSDGRLASGG